MGPLKAIAEAYVDDGLQSARVVANATIARGGNSDDALTAAIAVLQRAREALYVTVEGAAAE